MLTFIIPVRHQDNARDWAHLKHNLSRTIRSICGQSDPAWRAIIVANHGADLPVLPKGFEALRVDYPPNPHTSRAGMAQEDFLNAFRDDKGRRVLAGVVAAGRTGHIMISDDDDFVSNRLAGIAAKSSKANGWYFRHGYIWSGGRLLYRHPRFHAICGTSHIVRADLLGAPSRIEDADPEYVRHVLGSHISIDQRLIDAGTPLSPLPFPGAIYHTGHIGSVSSSRGLLQQYFTKELLLKPREACKRVCRIRLRTSAIEQEFFGISPSHA